MLWRPRQIHFCIFPSTVVCPTSLLQVPVQRDAFFSLRALTSEVDKNEVYNSTTAQRTTRCLIAVLPRGDVNDSNALRWMGKSIARWSGKNTLERKRRWRVMVDERTFVIFCK